MGPNHSDTLEATIILGEVRLLESDTASAEKLFRDALSNYETARSNSWLRYRSQCMLGASLAAEGKFDQAEPLLIGGYQGMIARRTTIPAQDLDVLDRAGAQIVHLYESWAKPDTVAEWKQKLHVE
jgi:hypothetical protein